MTVTVGIFEAKTRLSELLEQVQEGEEVLITKRGIPIALMQRVASPTEKTQATIDALARIRERAKSGSESFRELIEEGRRYA